MTIKVFYTIFVVVCTLKVYRNNALKGLTCTFLTLFYVEYLIMVYNFTSKRFLEQFQTFNSLFS